MYFLQVEARPKMTHPQRHKWGGASVNCWILRDTSAQAIAVARGWLGDEDWGIVSMTEPVIMTRGEQESHPEGIQYFEQAEVDREVFVVHTWPVENASQ